MSHKQDTLDGENLRPATTADILGTPQERERACRRWSKEVAPRRQERLIATHLVASTETGPLSF